MAGTVGIAIIPRGAAKLGTCRRRRRRAWRHVMAGAVRIAVFARRAGDPAIEAVWHIRARRHVIRHACTRIAVLARRADHRIVMAVNTITGIRRAGIGIVADINPRAIPAAAAGTRQHGTRLNRRATFRAYTAAPGVKARTCRNAGRRHARAWAHAAAAQTHPFIIGRATTTAATTARAATRAATRTTARATTRTTAGAATTRTAGAAARGARTARTAAGAAAR